jgi:RING finger/CHY zinc finger protein 1
MVKVLCNDCHEESTVKFHIFGHKCASEKDGVVCGSYNTRRI